METKNKKIEWSKPVLEEFAKVRYTLGTCEDGSTGDNSTNCNKGYHVGSPRCAVGGSTDVCRAGGTVTYPG